MGYTVPSELMMRWITCTCWRDGIQYVCFRPEFLVPQDFNGTSKYPCMEVEFKEAQEGEDSKAGRSLSPPGCSALSVTCLNPTLPEKP